MYENFKKLNGQHPWRAVSPEGYVDYPVRYRKNGRVLFFNFSLARELGLIPRNHSNKMTPLLETAILKTFSLRIINEYDWMHKKRFPRDGLEDRLYMATRYLQLQHKNKKGTTSGDGRSIWNGWLRTKTMTFDISSCGTGATILSPGAQEAKQALPTGDGLYGYSSGLADTSEMLGNALMAEIFYRKSIPTERCLAVIDFKDKSAIGVRTAPNLIRPAHIYRYLKLGWYEELKDSFDYFLNRQQENKFWKLPSQPRARYEKALRYLATTYAKLAAVLEEEYIFNWLAWDGDNVLASGALLDYGSIRQFAAKHDQYRYDDVDRFSTNLTEQRYWAKKMVQTFVQGADFILTKKKKSLNRFENHSCLRLFDRAFVQERQRRMLMRMGFTDAHIALLLKRHQKKIQAFRRVLNYFEDIKTVKGVRRVPDGIDHPPIFFIRHILRELPKYILKGRKNARWPVMPPERFCEIMASSYVHEKDLELTEIRKERSVEFQRLYRELIHAVNPAAARQTLRTVMKRSAVINYEYRSTGEGLLWIVDGAVNLRNHMNRNDLQAALDRFIESQVLVPEKWKPLKPHETRGTSHKARFLGRIKRDLKEYQDVI